MLLLIVEVSRSPSPAHGQTDLLLKLAPGRLFGVEVGGVDFALRNGPAAQVFLAEERTARVDQEHLEDAIAVAIQQDTGTGSRHLRRVRRRGVGRSNRVARIGRA